jgi:hypothetical protein
VPLFELPTFGTIGGHATNCSMLSPAIGGIVYASPHKCSMKKLFKDKKVADNFLKSKIWKEIFTMSL